MAESDLDAIVEFSLRAWAPVHDSIGEAVGWEVFRRLYPPDGDWRPRQEREVRGACSESRVWVADEGSQPVGFVAVQIVAEGLVGEIAMLAVDPARQRRGIGTALTIFAVDRIRDMGIKVAMVGTGSDAGHAPARKTYENAGFSLVPMARYFMPL